MAVLEQHENNAEDALHPCYQALPSYVSKDRLVVEKKYLLTKIEETLNCLKVLRTRDENATNSSEPLKKHHLRVILTYLELKHLLPVELHRQLIEELIHQVFEFKCQRLQDITMQIRAFKVLTKLLRKWKHQYGVQGGIYIDWKLAHATIEYFCFEPAKLHVSQQYLHQLSSGAVKCVEATRFFFIKEKSSKASTMVSEMWSTFRDSIKNIQSNKCYKSLMMFSLLLVLPQASNEAEIQEEQAIFESTLLPEWMEVWALQNSCAGWEGNWYKVISRVAKRFLTLSWEPYVAFIYGKIQTSMSLPSDIGSSFTKNAVPAAFTIINGAKRSDQYMARLVVYMLRNENSAANDLLLELFDMIEPYFHPSNASNSANSLALFLYFFSAYMGFRCGKEKTVSEDNKLSTKNIRPLLEKMLQMGFYGIYSRNIWVSCQCMYMLKNLICIDSSYCTAPILQQMVKALDPLALSQTHQALSAISTLSVIARHFFRPIEDGNCSDLLFSTYLTPILQLTLPGIDPNDERKTRETVTFYEQLLLFLPFINQTTTQDGNLSEKRAQLFDEMNQFSYEPVHDIGAKQTLHKLIHVGSLLEEWGMMLLEKIFTFIQTRATSGGEKNESSNSSSGSNKSRSKGKKYTSKLQSEDMLLFELAQLAEQIFQQMSPELYQVALRKTVDFVSTRVFFGDSKIAGKVISQLVQGSIVLVSDSSSLGPAELSFRMWMDLIIDKLLHETTSHQLMASEKVWYLRILDGIVRKNRSEKGLLDYEKPLKTILRTFLNNGEEKKVRKIAGKVLKHLLRALVEVYPLDMRSFPASNLNDGGNPLDSVGLAYNWGHLDIKWHEPNEEELRFATELLQDHVAEPLRRIDTQLITSETIPGPKDVTLWIALIKQIVYGLRGARELLNDDLLWNFEANALLGGNTPAIKSKSAAVARFGADLRIELMQKSCKMMTFWASHEREVEKKSSIWLKLLRLVKWLLVWRGCNEKKLVADKLVASASDRARIDMPSRIHTRVIKAGSKKFKVWYTRREMIEKLQLIRTKRIQEQNYSLGYTILKASEEGQSDISKEASVGTLWRNLLDQVMFLLRDPYEPVRVEANGVLSHSKVYSKWLIGKTFELIETMEKMNVNTEPIQKCDEQVIGSVLVLMEKRCVINFIWKDKQRGALARLLKLLVNPEACQRLVNVPEEQKKNKLEKKLQKFYLTVLAFYQNTSNAQGKNMKLLEELVQVADFFSSAQADNANVHWKFQLMQVVTFLPFLTLDPTSSEEAATILGKIWGIVIKQVGNTMFPVRQAALLVLSHLVHTHKIHPQKTSTVSSSVESMLLNADFLKTLNETLYQNQKMSNRFAASADSQHAFSNANFLAQWSFGVNEVLMTLLSESYRGRSLKRKPIAPVQMALHPPKSANGSSQLNLLASMQLVQDLVLLNPGAFKQLDFFKNVLSPFITSEIENAQASDKQQALTTLVEWVGGLGRAFMKLNDQESITKILDGILKRVLPNQVTVVLADEWIPMLFFMTRPASKQKLSSSCLQILVEYFISQVEIAFETATGEDYARQAKWLRFLEPILIQVLFAKDLDSSRHALASNLSERVVQVVLKHALAHHYKMIRDQVAKTLYLIGHFNFDAVREPLEKLVLLVQDEEKDAELDEVTKKTCLYARETAISWISWCDSYGTAKNFGLIMRQLFPIVFSSQNHADMELAVLSKNTTNDISVWVRLLYFSEKQTSTINDMEALLTLLEEYSRSPSWKKRGAVLRFLTAFAFYHWMFFSRQLKQRIKDLVISLLTDDQREVQEMAKYVLRTLLHNEKTEVLVELSESFLQESQKSRTLYSKLVRRLNLPNLEEDKKQEAIEKIKSCDKKMVRGLLGMASIVLAFPYSVPSFVPPLIEEMGKFLYMKHSSASLAVSYLEKAAKDTLLEFKRTHQDNWNEAKTKFTPDQLSAIEDVLISPHYYT